MIANVSMDDSWKKVLSTEFSQPYMAQLKAFLAQTKKAKKTIYPKGRDIFNAFDLTPFDEVKVVVLGQDPYHGPGQAHGLCFSVQPTVPIPPSLLNIFKELKEDLGISLGEHGCLSSWAKQGVLLLNSVLTVEDGQAASHQDQGWETFTDAVITKLNAERSGLVFILWGSYAHRKGDAIDEDKHLVLKSVHPSPLSAYRGFFGSRPFSKTNAYLLKQGSLPIDWQLPALSKIKE